MMSMSNSQKKKLELVRQNLVAKAVAAIDKGIVQCTVGIDSAATDKGIVQRTVGIDSAGTYYSTIICMLMPNACNRSTEVVYAAR